MNHLPREFFLQPTPEVAKQLLGVTLLVRGPEGETGGVIVETEAYLGSEDAAAHSFRGETPRTKAMFGEPGRAYVYFTYGLHTCLNIVTGSVGTGHAVLVRAIEPTLGIELMKKRRGRTELKDLCSGPAKLVQALGVTLADNGEDFLAGNRLALQPRKNSSFEITITSRIGITKAADLPYRFYIKNSPFVSG